MSYLHLQKNWPIALSIIAHITVLSWVNNASISPTQTSAPLKTVTVTLVEFQSRKIPHEIAQPVKPSVTEPLIKPVSAQRLIPAIESVMLPEVPINTQTAHVTELTTETHTEQDIEAVTKTHTEQVTKILPARTTEEYTPPSLSAEYLHNPEPKYPLMARRRGEQGNVLLQVTVSETGQAVIVIVLQSSGYALLDQSAVRAVKNWQFVPARSNQQAVIAQVTVPVRFTLES